MLDPCEQFSQLPDRLLKGQRRSGILLKKLHDSRTGLDGEIEFHVGAGDIGADVHKIFDVLIDGRQAKNPLDMTRLIRLDNVAAHAADALEHINGGIMTPIGQGAAQPDMTIHDAFYRVGDRLVEIIAFNQDCIKAGDRAALAAAGALENLRE